MRFDECCRRISNNLVTEQESIEQACAWRDLAVRAATGHPPVTA